MAGMGLINGESFGQTQGSLDASVSNLQQFSPVYSQGANSSPFWQKSAAAANPGFLPSFFNKVGSVFSEGAHMVEGAAGFVGRTLGEAAMAVVHLPSDAAKLGQNSYESGTFGLKQNYISAQINQAMQEYKGGYMSKSQFQSAMADLGKQSNDLSHQIGDFVTKTKSDEGQAMKDLINTAADIITVATAGLTSPLSAGAEKGSVDFGQFLMSKQAADIMAPAESAIGKMAQNKALFDAMPTYIQKNVQASVTDTLMNGAASFASKDFARASAVNMAIKYPLAFNWLSGTGNKVYAEMQSGKYGEAVKTLGFNAGLLLAGGPVGDAFLKLGASGVKSLAGKTFGSTSFIDTFSNAIFGDSSTVYKTIKDDPEMIKGFQAMEATNLPAAGGRTVSAVYRVVNGLKMNAVPDFKTALEQTPDLTPKQYLDTYVMGWHKAQSALTEGLIKSGMSADEARKYVVGRWTTYDANRVATAVTMGKLEGENIGMTGIDNATPQGSEDMLQNWDALTAANPNAAFSNNPTLRNQITHIIKTSDNVEEANTRIRAISAQTGKEFVQGATPELAALGGEIGKLGYVPIVPKNLEAPFVQGTQKLVTSAGEGEFFQKAVQPVPVLKEFGALLTNIGLSPQRAEQSTQEIFTQNFSKNLRETSLFKGTAAGSKATELEGTTWANNQYQKISDYVQNVNSRTDLHHPPITNVRQLTKKELAEALQISHSQAGEVQSAISQSILDMTWAQRGLANKAQDILGNPMQKYLRIQGAGRFAWNPVFKMKLGYKTEFLTQAETGGKAPTFLGTNKILQIFFPKYYKNLNATDSLLHERGMYGTGFTNEAATEETLGAGAPLPSSVDQTITASRIQGLTRSQRLSISGMVNVMAERTGQPVEQFLNEFPNETRGAIESILHYNPNASFLNSNMAKMLNVAIFPFRFNVKVSSYMAKVLVRQDWVTRTAVINGLMQSHDFLTSTQGQIWYSQNSDAISLLKYFSPLETLSTVANLGGITHESLGAFGELGGLPVGFIPQILQAEGLWNPSTAYVNPQTGQPGTDYIPQNGKAALATALSSFVGSLFTYPGSVVGLPSKTGTLAKAAQGVTGSNPNDWQKVPETNLTPEQQQFSQTVQQLQQSSQGQPQAPAAPAMPGAVTEPTTGNAIAAPRYKNGSSTPPAKKLKKSQEPVSPLPGQARVGVL